MMLPASNKRNPYPPDGAAIGLYRVVSVEEPSFNPIVATD
jgi:hypothetical protein